jgi:hypothetical protein
MEPYRVTYLTGTVSWKAIQASHEPAVKMYVPASQRSAFEKAIAMAGPPYDPRAIIYVDDAPKPVGGLKAVWHRIFG